MGIIAPYFPTEMATKLAGMAKAEVFVETGTYMGNTSIWASCQFKTVHTIEWSEVYFREIKDKLLPYKNIFSYLGNSRDVLPKILLGINANTIFWLDAHYSMPESAGKEEPCPLLKELEVVLSREHDDIIIIDDARCLLGAKGWPSMNELYKKIESSSVKNKHIAVCDDIVYIVPDESKYKELILNYVLERNAILWKQDKRYRNPKPRDVAVIALKIIGLYNFAKGIYTKIKKKE